MGLSFDPPGKLTTNNQSEIKETRPMGLMSRIFGGKIASNGNGGDLSGHNISKNNALSATDNAVPSPKNADFSSVRSIPVLQKPRYFTIQEAAALEAIAAEKETMAKAAKRAYRSLKRVDHADTEVHTSHRRYQGVLAQNEVEKLQANARLAEKLHGLRPDYERMGQRIEAADNAAASAIAAIKNSYGG